MALAAESVGESRRQGCVQGRVTARPEVGMNKILLGCVVDGFTGACIETRYHSCSYCWIHCGVAPRTCIRVELSEHAGVGIARGEKHCNDQKYSN